MPYCASIAKLPPCISLSSLTTREIWSLLLQARRWVRTFYIQHATWLRIATNKYTEKS